MHRIKIVFVFLVLSTMLVQAQKYSNEFLTLPVGARAQSMGGATISSAADVYSAFINPAGLAAIEDSNVTQLAAMHAEWFAGVGKYDYLGIALPSFNGARRMAFSVMRFGIDGIPNTLNLYNADGTFNYDNISSFSAADYAFLVSYAQPLQVSKGNLFLGSSAKVIFREIGPFAKAYGFGLDLGLQYKVNAWQFGLMVKDITSTFNAWRFSFTNAERENLLSSGNVIPENSIEITKPSLIVGAAWSDRWKDYGLLAEINAVFQGDGQRNALWSGKTFSMSPALGLEFDYKKFVFLRLGISNVQQEVDLDGNYWSIQPNVGLGLRILSFTINYAFTDIGDISNQSYSHVISLRLDLKKKK